MKENAMKSSVTVTSLLVFFLLGIGCVQCVPIHHTSPSITTLTSLLTSGEQSPITSLSNDDSKFLEQGLGCLTPTRLQTIYDFYSLASDTPRSSRISLFDNEEWLSNLLYDESTFLVRYKGSRIFKTVADTVEYFALGNGDLNGGDINVYFTSIKEIQECEDENSVVLVAESLITSSFDGEKADISIDKFLFGPDSSSLIVEVDTNVPTTVTIILENSQFDRQEFCDIASIRCPGELFPYANLAECYETTSYISDRCSEGVKDDYTGGILQGDTMACRYLHLFSTGLRPIVHCPHLSDVSEVCVPEECPSATRLDIPYQVLNEFDAGHSMWIRIIELIVLGVVILFVVGAYLWYIQARRRFQHALYGTVPPIESSFSSDAGTINHTIDYSTNHRPYLQFNHLKISWIGEDKNDDPTTILHWDQGYLGHCNLTCMTGKSGSGKTSFIQSLCGYDVCHINLQVGQWSRRDPVAYCPQSVDIWPKEMLVRDILLFACVMNKANAKDYYSAFDALELHDVMDQEFYTLSGGQQQRVNVAATIIRAEPTLIFLDEPLATLDEKNAIACLQTLKDLPVQHSFIITVHNVTPSIKDMFDRHIHLDGKIDQRLQVLEKSIPTSSPPPTITTITHDEIEYTYRGSMKQPTVWSMNSSIKASLILWFGQISAKPIVEMLTLIFSVLGAIFVGCLARMSTAEWEDSFMPTEEAIRVPFYLADILVGLAFISSFGCSLVFANRERMIMKHFATLRMLHPYAYMLALMIFRSMAFAILQAFCWIFISLSLLGLSFSHIDIILMNTILFAFSWSVATFGAALMVTSPLYSAHMIMVMDVFMVFFSGVFFYMSRLYGVFKVIHYMNPLFYILSASAYVMGAHMLNTGCNETQHPGECASGLRVLEMSDIVPFTSLMAQGLNLVFVCIVWLSVMYRLRPRELIIASKKEEDALKDDSVSEDDSGDTFEDSPSDL